MYDFNELERMVTEMKQTACTAAARMRAQKAAWYLTRYEINDGVGGCINELYNASKYSHKKGVASANKNDNSINFLNENGKVVHYIGESKVNGGRVESLFKKNPPRFFIYTLNIKNKLVPERQTACRKLIPTETVLQYFEEHPNTLKNTNGKTPERAIQVVLKSWIAAIQDWPIDYDPDEIYESWMFDGLEL